MMKRIVIIVLSFTIFWACKENTKHDTKPRSEQSTLKTDSVSRPPIKVFTIIHDSISIDDIEQLTKLNKGLDKVFQGR